MPIFPPHTLTAFADALFRAAGVPADEAATVAASLVGANLRGHDSHGLIRIPQYLKAVRDGLLRPGAPFTVVRETPAVLTADGNWGLGQLYLGGAKPASPAHDDGRGKQHGDAKEHSDRRSLALLRAIEHGVDGRQFE